MPPRHQTIMCRLQFKLHQNYSMDPLQSLMRLPYDQPLVQYPLNLFLQPSILLVGIAMILPSAAFIDHHKVALVPIST